MSLTDYDKSFLLKKGVVSDARQGYRGTEWLFFYYGGSRNPFGSVPIVFCHDTGESMNPSGRNENMYTNDFRWMNNIDGFSLMAADNGGPSDYTNNDALAAIDDGLANIASMYGVNTSKVLFYGVGAGALLALNWTWRHPNRVLGLSLSMPIVAFQDYYNANAGQQAAIQTAFGGVPVWATYDPMQNIDLIRPFGDRISLFYSEDDTTITPASVEAFGNLVGAWLAPPVTGSHATAAHGLNPNHPTAWLVEQAVDRRAGEVVWNYTSWDDLDEWLVSDCGGCELRYSNIDAVGGRRGLVEDINPGVGGNWRAVHTIPGLFMADSEIHNVIHSANGQIGGQQGNFHRVVTTDYDTGQAHVVWQNIIFNAGWVMNGGVLEWDNGVLTVIDQVIGYTAPGFTLATGGEVLATSRSGNVARLVCDFNIIPQVGEVLLVSGVADASFNGTHIPFAVNADTGEVFSTQVGADTTSGGSGEFMNGSRVFPYNLKSRCWGGDAANGACKIWPLGMDEPEWGDPDWGTNFTFPSRPARYGRQGFMIAHIGDNGIIPFIEQGTFKVTEL